MSTNEKKIRLTLDNIGEFLSKLAEQSDHVYWLSSPDFTQIQYISPAYEKIWGRSREELYLNPEIWITFSHPEDALKRHPIKEMIDKIDRLGEAARFSENYRIIRPDGEVRWIMDNGFPIFDDNGICCGVTGVATDVTNEKAYEQQLRKAKEAAEAAAQSKAAFIANMSHDLRTPLAGIIGLSLMMRNEAHTTEQKQNAQWIHDSGERLLDLFNGILDVISAENKSENNLHNESFNLRECLKSIVQLELPTTKCKKLDLRVEIDENIPTHIVSDQMKLHSVILNLLGNAIKFTKTGCITIKVSTLERKSSEIYLQFSVMDTGIGIPLESRDKVFDRFYRATPSYKGTYEGHGVGLHIAQTYVKLLGGHIRLTSEEGVGTTFRFDLRCKIENERNALPEDTCQLYQESTRGHHTPIINSMQIINNNSPLILLIEDNPIALRVIETLVKTANCRSKSSTNGEHALELVKTHNFDLILTDIGLPGISGHDFTQRFRAWEKDEYKNPITVIGLTAHMRKETVQECLLSGMNDVYSKPANIAMIQSILQRFALK